VPTYGTQTQRRCSSSKKRLPAYTFALYRRDLSLHRPSPRRDQQAETRSLIRNQIGEHLAHLSQELWPYTAIARGVLLSKPACQPTIRGMSHSEQREAPEHHSVNSQTDVSFTLRFVFIAVAMPG
jgi:hypothetical protein